MRDVHCTSRIAFLFFSGPTGHSSRHTARRNTQRHTPIHTCNMNQCNASPLKHPIHEHEQRCMPHKGMVGYISQPGCPISLTEFCHRPRLKQHKHAGKHRQAEQSIQIIAGICRLVDIPDHKAHQSGGNGSLPSARSMRRS